MSSAPRWDVHHLPPQSRKTFLVTGAGSGIGFFIAEQLAAAGAHVVLAARTPQKLDLAMQAIRMRVPEAQLRSLPMDLADNASIEAAVGTLSGTVLDGAVFNAGLLQQGQRRETKDGHELVLGTNYLGHFVLGSLLFATLVPGSRIVTMSSVAARWTKELRLDDMESTASPYQGFKVYKMSKLAQAIFAFELDRRLRASDSTIASLVAHPGGALDGLTPSRPPVHARRAADLLKALPKSPLAQGKDAAAWPAVRALTDPAAEGGQLWGPRLARSKGRPVLERPTTLMQDAATARRLWAWTEQATGIAWPAQLHP
ncbi:SDR family NAD(P)-dependent oxidoreductase [Streptomyces tubercidicus]|uniref:SDR family NAD(P)-dependent oxidoreductase n=1 Tax=Streptomyces tubercidicus TaxID=47759 RepID=UPI002E0E1648|nr:SDR family NAD(P)-dependent oxidoreductase [Streptomyces tubercidicus]WSX21825.1 SDR family NAD(P)-dependent oxidoreductase [Streptomyces tubercidicus]